MEERLGQLRVPHAVAAEHGWRWGYVVSGLGCPHGRPGWLLSHQGASATCWARRSLPSSAAVSVGRVVGWGSTVSSGVGSVCLLVASTFVATPTAADDGKDDKATDTGGEANYQGFVAIDPFFCFVAERGTNTLTLWWISFGKTVGQELTYVLAFAPTNAGCAI